MQFAILNTIIIQKIIQTSTNTNNNNLTATPATMYLSKEHILIEQYIR